MKQRGSNQTFDICKTSIRVCYYYWRINSSLRFASRGEFFDTHANVWGMLCSTGSAIGEMEVPRNVVGYSSDIINALLRSNNGWKLPLLKPETAAFPPVTWVCSRPEEQYSSGEQVTKGTAKRIHIGIARCYNVIVRLRYL